MSILSAKSRIAGPTPRLAVPALLTALAREALPAIGGHPAMARDLQRRV